MPAGDAGIVRPMRKRALIIFAAAVFAAALAVGVFFGIEKDPAYRLAELAALGGFGAFDQDIARAAARQGIDPLLVKAVIWKESRFQPQKIGAAGERGLMQVTEPAAQDWAKANGITSFVPTDLLDPKTNIEVGTWYLAKALRHWNTQEDPLPFALGEYNAGRSRVKRWSGGVRMSSTDLTAAMDIPSTRSYVESVRRRYNYYLHRQGKGSLSLGKEAS